MAHSSSTSRRIWSSAAAIALVSVVTLGLAACAPEPSAPNSAVTGAELPVATGTAGAAHLDDGYLQVGTGAKVVDVYVDLMCPICGVFEETNGANLTELVDSGEITQRIHPMNFLNRASNGTDYSSRAAAALTCVAASDEKLVLPYLSALFAEQPKENSDGLTDDELISIAEKVGATDVADCVNAGTYITWVQSVNDKALSGPIEGADIEAVKGTPTVLVNGKSFPGAVNDAAALEAFIAAN
ncbi:DsbA family protein [Leifsonia sp. A12D58]|uniref:DsbA family protein n=1 Tax=Leifsonia sp. A12D58 TaxID=3397674 RepID=UPI0039E0D2B1